jgi:GNAT superfamily N-acetyltransferase
MPTIDQHSVKALARALDPLAVLAWPARATEEIDGWLLRFSEGYSSRSNSVSALEFRGDSLALSIERVEAAYRRHHLAPQFQISPATEPERLEAALQARGYACKPPTAFMVAEARGVAEAGDVRVLGVADADFIRLTREGSHSPADGSERLETLARITLPKAFCVAYDHNEAVACGASVATGDWASVYVMRTAPAQRGRGHGRRVLGAIAAWALGQGARQLYLQVDEANAPAVSLYLRAGFHFSYRYLHFHLPRSSV